MLTDKTQRLITLLGHFPIMRKETVRTKFISRFAFSATLAFLLTFSFLSAPVSANDLPQKGQSQLRANSSSSSRNVKVGMLSDDSISDVDKDITSFLKDYIEAVAEYASWNIEYVSSSWSDLIDKLEKGTIDVMLDVSKTSQRETYFDFSSEPMGTEMTCLYGKSDTKLSFNDYSGFNGMTVGYENGSTIIDSLSQFAQDNGFSFTPKAYENTKAIFDGISNGEVDTGVTTNYYSAGSSFALLAKCQPSPIYIATNKAVPALKKEVDEAMTFLFNYNPAFNSDLFEYHFGSSLSEIAYTAEEKAYLAAKPTVNVYYETNWAPFEYDNDGKAEGITPEVIRAIGDKTGINFHFILSSSTQDIYKDIEASGIDTIMAVSYSYIWANNHKLWATQPYAKGSVMQAYKTAGITPKTVAVSSSGYLANEITNKYPELTQVPYLTFSECMEAVRTGKADCTFLNYYQAIYYRSTSQYKDFSYQTCENINQDISLGVTMTSNQVLLHILSKSIQHLSSTTLQSILNSNSVYTEPPSLMTFFYRYPVQSSIILACLFLLVCLIVFLAIYSESRKKQNLALAQAKAEAEKANRAKSDFLSRMSHDIRTPLNGIIGMSGLAGESNSSPQVADYLSKIDTSSKFLLSLVNDILDMSKAESGEITLHPEPYPEEELTAYIRAVFIHQAEQKKQHLTLDFPSEKDRIVIIDKLRINQIIFNLLSNALKFTQEGGQILLSISRQDIGEQCLLTLTVTDNGPGMSQEFQKILFQPFAQENTNPDVTAKTGTGLGMAITKKLVEAMGGSIQVKSEVGKGSTFIVSLKTQTMAKDEYLAKKALKTSAQASQLTSLAGKRILLCEDNDLNEEIAQNLLVKKGLLVEWAKDGEEGVRLYVNGQDNYYNGILMDVRMPKKDGIEATMEIRASEKPDAKTIPIIAMTADAFSEDIEKCLASGMNAHLAKPIDPEALYSKLAEFIK
jgi:signal transduction histidine kinase